jgi:hypothetical protein
MIDAADAGTGPPTSGSLDSNIGNTVATIWIQTIDATGHFVAKHTRASLRKRPPTEFG